jgi:hypothetical protein
MAANERLGPIQILPQGLTGLVGLKNLGRVPSDLLTDVSPVIDIEPYWLRYTAKFQQTGAMSASVIANTFSFVPFSPPVFVPNGETWFVHAYSVEVLINGLLATEIVDQWAPAYRDGSLVGVNQIHLLTNPFTLLGNTVYQARQQITASDFWLRPGIELGFYVGNLRTGGSILFTAKAIISRLTV